MASNESIDHLRRTLADLMAWFDDSSLHAAVIGGVAVSIQGRPRLTRDVDAVVVGEDADRLIGSGAPHHFLPRVVDAVEFAHRTRVLLLRHESGIDVDFSLGALPFEEEVVERSHRIDVGGLLVRVATPEDLIVMKAVARRPQDIADIVGIVEVHPELDVERVRYWVREFSAVLEMPEIYDDLERLLRSRSR